jgi:hypothetical protein
MNTGKLQIMGYVVALALVLSLGVQQPARANSTGAFLGGLAAGAILDNALGGPAYGVPYGYDYYGTPPGYRQVCRWVWRGGRDVLQCSLRPDYNYGYGTYGYYVPPTWGFSYRSPGYAVRGGWWGDRDDHPWRRDRDDHPRRRNGARRWR